LTESIFYLTYRILVSYLFIIGFTSNANDPFSSQAGGFSKGKIHVRIQQRNGRKCITTIQGLEDDLDLKRICKAMKRSFNCNGSIANDEEKGEVIQLQGDQRDNSKEWLLAQEIILPAEADRIVIHGF
jgi:translation initiation factor 1